MWEGLLRVPRGRLPRFQPTLEVIPEESPAWEGLATRLLHWNDHGRWYDDTLAQRIEWLLLFEDS